MQIRKKNALVRGVRVQYGEVGDGPPLLLVHGFLVSHKEWIPVLPHLVSHFRCILPDLPGSGASEMPDPRRFSFTREDFAETLLGILDHLELPSAHLAGHSMGGSVALVLAADHPDRVRRLTVIDSACYPFDVPLKGRLPLVPILGGIIFKHLYRRAVFRDYFKNEVWSGRDGIDFDRVDEYYEDFASAAARESAYLTLQRTVDVTSLVPKLKRVRAETLVLWGDDDRIFPRVLAEQLAAELPQAELRIIDSCGHAPNEAHPRETAEAIVAHHLGAEP